MKKSVLLSDERYQLLLKRPADPPRAEPVHNTASATQTPVPEASGAAATANNTPQRDRDDHGASGNRLGEGGVKLPPPPGIPIDIVVERRALTKRRKQRGAKKWFKL